MMKGLWFFCKFGWRTDKKYIIYNVLYQLIHSLFPLVNVLFPKYIIDGLITGKNPKYLFICIGILAGYNFATDSIANWLSLNVFTLRCKVAADFGLYMHKKLAHADFENLENPDFLDQKEKANKFLYGDGRGFSYVFDSALNMIGQFIALTSVTVIILTLNVWMVLLLLILILTSSLVEHWAKKNELKLALEQVKVERGWSYFGGLFENFIYGKEIRINSLADWLLTQEKEYSRKALTYYERRNRFYIKSGFAASLMTLLQQCAAYAYLVYRTLHKAITIGDFTMYLGAVTAFSTAMRCIMSSFVDVKAYGIYYEAMQDYLNIPNKMRANRHLPFPNGDHTIEFRGVSFRYAGQTNDTLKNINITLRPGEKLSVVGENGAGKTTFIKLLTRLYDPTEGEILVDGINIQDIDYDSYMSLFSAVFQDFKLFSFSLKDNISLSGTSEEVEIRQLLSRVGLFGKLNSLPEGIYTNINKEFDEKGFEPSGGEGQKIALARALFKNAPIIVLDEPAAALDPKAEYEMYEHFNELVMGKTAVYISHRLSSARFCDKIAVFHNGRIAEYGSHDELIIMKGKYAELFHMQAQYYTDIV